MWNRPVPIETWNHGSLAASSAASQRAARLVALERSDRLLVRALGADLAGDAELDREPGEPLELVVGTVLLEIDAAHAAPTASARRCPASVARAKSWKLSWAA